MRSLVDSFSLREINFAKTRLNILQVVKDRMIQKDFENITVDEICRFAEISRGTFFNYFPTKNHIFNYYIRIWIVQMGLEMEDESFKDKPSEEKINNIYNKVIEEDKKSPGFINNYLKYLLETKETKNEIKLTQAEFAYQFSLEKVTSNEIEKLNNLSLEKILENFLIQGINSGKFKKDLNIEHTLLLLVSMFFSPIIAKHINKSYDLKKYYEDSLNNILHNMEA